MLLDWAGLTEGDQPMPYDKDRAKVMLTDPAYRPFLDAAVWAANVTDNESAEASEKLEKNSQPPSAGTSKKAQAAAE